MGAYLAALADSVPFLILFLFSTIYTVFVVISPAPNSFYCTNPVQLAKDLPDYASTRSMQVKTLFLPKDNVVNKWPSRQ